MSKCSPFAIYVFLQKRGVKAKKKSLTYQRSLLPKVLKISAKKNGGGPACCSFFISIRIEKFPSASDFGIEWLNAGEKGRRDFR